jgi:hypothetical protein
MTRFLDETVLADFEGALRSAGAAIAEAWAPGLNDAQIDELIAPHGIDLPEEARRWWRWHDGFVAGTPPPRRDLTPRRPLFDLAMTLEVFASGRAGMWQLEGVDAWLQPAGSKPIIYFACDGARDEPVPVYAQEDIETPLLALPSIGELVAAWTELIEQRIFTTDSDGLWESDFEKIPPEIQQLGIY